MPSILEAHSLAHTQASHAPPHTQLPRLGHGRCPPQRHWHDAALEISANIIWLTLTHAGITRTLTTQLPRLGHGRYPPQRHWHDAALDIIANIIWLTRTRAGITRTLFTHSYLGLGMDAALRKGTSIVLAQQEQGTGQTDDKIDGGRRRQLREEDGSAAQRQLGQQGQEQQQQQQQQQQQ